MGNLSAPLWIVTTAPKNVDTAGPMSCATSKEIIQYLYGLGLTVEDIRFEYLWYQPVPRSGLFTLPRDEWQHSVNELKVRIQNNKPNLVLFMGQDCLKVFHNQNKLSDWMGHTFWNEELGCKVFYTYDPFMAHLQRFVDKKEKPGQYITLVRNHLKKVSLEYKTKEIAKFKSTFITAPSFSQAKDYLLSMLENASIISYDIEVLEPYDGRLMDCIGLAYKWDEAICIPFYINTQEGLQRYWKNDSEFYEIFSLVKRVMESDIPKVAQNSQFDTTMLARYSDIHVKNLVWDTMVAAHNLFCDLPKSLGTLISLYTNLPYHKYLVHSPHVQDRWEYNAADAIANLHVMSGEIKEFCDIEETCGKCSDNVGKFCLQCFNLYCTKAGSHYLAVTNSAIEHCIDMHIAGVRVDRDIRDKILHTESTHMKDIIFALIQAFPYVIGTGKDGMKLNPNSPADKKALFYIIMNCKPVYNKNVLTTDSDALESFLEDERKYVGIIARALMQYSESKASISKFVIEPDNGYIRTKYDISGTDTGRLASTESDVMKAGTNLQNVAKGPQRQMIIPEVGEEFALVDLYAAEAYLNALDAGESEMINMISGFDCENVTKQHGCRVMSAKEAEKYKIHNWMQKVTQAKFPEECKQYNYTYKLAKQAIHGLNYGVEPEKMSKESGLPKTITQWQYAMYHAKFPGIQGRMRRVDSEVLNKHCLSTSLGRRRIFIQDYSKALKNQAYAWPNQSTIGEIAILAFSYLHLISNIHREDGTKYVWAKPVLNTHDGLAVRIKKNTRGQVIPYILNAFNIPLTLHNITIRIPVSIGFGPNFNDMSDEMVYFYK